MNKNERAFLNLMGIDDAKICPNCNIKFYRFKNKFLYKGKEYCSKRCILERRS